MKLYRTRQKVLKIYVVRSKRKNQDQRIFRSPVQLYIGMHEKGKTMKRKISGFILYLLIKFLLLLCFLQNIIQT